MYINYITTLRSNEETSRSYNKWTHEEELKLANEISQKKTLQEIALEHKRTLGAIKSRIISSIIYPEYIGCNTNFDELSEKYNIEKELIEKYIEKIDIKNNVNTCLTYNKWTHEEELKLANEISQKKTLQEIALEHKRTLHAIKSRIIINIIYPEYIDGNMNFDEFSEKYNIEKELIEKYIENKTEKIINNNSIDIKFNYDNILLLLENNISSIEKKLDSICKIIDK